MDIRSFKLPSDKKEKEEEVEKPVELKDDQLKDISGGTIPIIDAF